jgi:4-hydroxybenzoate polyprenyltransferase
VPSTSAFFPGFLRHSSLEVALGAVAANMAAHRYLSEQVPFGMEQVLLGLATLGIYGIDRIADVRRGNALKPGHHFYAQHIKAMTVFTGACCLAGLVLALYQGARQREILQIGGPMALAAGVYLLAVQATRRLKLPYIKEPWVAILYSSAIWALPIVETPGLARPGLFMLFAWVLLAMLNLLVSTAEEAGYDRAEGGSSLSIILGQRISTWLTYLLLGGLIFCCGQALRFQNGLLPWITSGLGMATSVMGFLPPRPGKVFSRRFIVDGLLILSVAGAAILGLHG